MFAMRFRACAIREKYRCIRKDFLAF